MPIKKSHGVRALVAAACAIAALPGTASAAEAGACSTPTLTRPFESIGDANRYFMAPGGDFESAGVWSVSGDSDYRYAGHGDAWAGPQALDLESGSSATSPTFCVDDTYPHIRLAAKADRGLSVLSVSAIEDGVSVPLGTISGADHASWQYSGFVSLAAPVGLLDGERTQLKLRVRAIGGGWQVDGVSVDPRSGG